MRGFWWAALVVAASGCFIGAGNEVGKTCETNVDCAHPLVCAQVRGTTRTCELLRGPDPGEGTPPSMVRPIDYCHDVKPIIDRTCIANCHGADMTRGTTGFRLDQYEFGDGTPGVFAKGERVRERTADDSMPPVNPANPRPDASERALIGKWVAGGKVFCFDAGM